MKEQRKYIISDNERVKVLRPFLTMHKLKPGKSVVYMTIRNGLLIVSPRPLDDKPLVV